MGWGQSNIADLTKGTMAACHRKERKGRGAATQRARAPASPTALRRLGRVWSYFSGGPCFISCCKACAIEIKLGIQMDPNKEHANGLNKDHGCPCYLMLRSNTGNADGEENSPQPVTPALFGLAYGTYERNRVSARSVLTILLGTMPFSGPEE